MSASAKLLKRPCNWSTHYGERHRFQRVTNLPTGLLLPKRVRIYFRSGRYLLQWWSPVERKNVALRIDGDLLNALSKAREIDERLGARQGAGLGARRLAHADLVAAYKKDLNARADACEIAIATARRYDAALDHYLAFAGSTEVMRKFPTVNAVNRDCALAFSAFLANRNVAPNGAAVAVKRPMRSPAYVLDVVRAMFEWAIDPDRGGRLPDSFRNPFRKKLRRSNVVDSDPTRAPDITNAMAAEFLEAADDTAFPLFAVLAFFGLRAAEPCFLFSEHLKDGWLSVPNLPGLSYQTKGRRDKRFPVPVALQALLASTLNGRTAGLLFERRAVIEGLCNAPLRGRSLAELTEEFRIRLDRARRKDASTRQTIRNALLRDAGCLSYDDINNEFKRIAKRLGWPKAATLKDFRHLFATALVNAGTPEPYRKFLMGHAPGRDAIINYTHLDRLREQMDRVVNSEFKPLLAVLEKRVRKSRRAIPAHPLGRNRGA